MALTNGTLWEQGGVGVLLTLLLTPMLTPMRARGVDAPVAPAPSPPAQATPAPPPAPAPALPAPTPTPPVTPTPPAPPDNAPPAPDATTLEMDVPDDPDAPAAVRATTRLTYLTQNQRGRDTGVPLVAVRLNDKLTATFILDTGTSVCSVTDAMAAKLGLTPQATQEPATPEIMDGPTATQVPLTVQLGGFRFPHLRAFVIKESRVSRVLGSAPDGILGINLLSRLAILLDPKGHALTLLYPGKLSPADLPGVGMGGAGTLRLTPARNGTYWAALTFRSGERAGQSSLMIDTGAVTTIVPHSLAEQLGLAPLKSNVPTEFGNGAFTADLARMPVLLLGAVAGGAANPSGPASQLALNNGLVLYAHDQETLKRAPHVLGMNILSGGLLLLDFPGRALYLAPATLGAAPQQ